MSKDFYALLRQELTALEGLLRGSVEIFLPSSKRIIERKIARIERFAIRIGGQTLKDTQSFKHEVEQFLAGTLDPREVHAMLLKALQLEQETREL